jgi:hypothetical protein
MRHGSHDLIPVSTYGLALLGLHTPWLPIPPQHAGSGRIRNFHRETLSGMMVTRVHFFAITDRACSYPSMTPKGGSEQSIQNSETCARSMIGWNKERT